MYAKIENGHHRGNPVTGIFPVSKAWANGKITLKASPGTFGNTVPTPRVQVEQDDIMYCDKDGNQVDIQSLANSNPLAKEVQEQASETNYEAEFIANETEDEAMNRIQKTFNMVEELGGAAEQGIVRGAVISGPPGIGKSHGIEQVFKEANLTRVLKNQDPNYTVVKGAASAIGLYQILYFYRQKNQTVIFDDCDSVLFDDVSLNLLKAALDSGKKRTISWNTESRVLDREDLPKQFNFEGSVIFISNIDFERTKASKIADHLKAIMSRCHYLSLEMSTQRDLILRVKQVVRDGMLNDYNLTQEQRDSIVQYIEDNANYLREISLRMVTKIADIVVMKPTGWQEFVESTCLKREAKFKRLVAEQHKAHGETA